MKSRYSLGVIQAFGLFFVMTTAVCAQNYEYSPFYQPNLAQINVTSSLHAELRAYIANSSAATNVGVAILDGRADSKHPDLNGRLTISTVYKGSYRTFDAHGTHVAGIVGASRNGIGIVGVAPNAKLISIPVFDDRNWVANDLGRAALNRAVSLKARVANMSYGPVVVGDVFLTGELNVFDDFGGSLVLVRAAGNDGVNAMHESYAFDASSSLSHLLIVGSVDDSGYISSFSNRPGNACIGNAGCAADDMMKNFFMVAPGEDIASDVPGKKYAYMSGTSMAAPHVSGAAALVFQQALAGNQVLTPSQVAGILKQSAEDLGEAGVDGVYGWGLLDVAAALNPVGGTFTATRSSLDGGLINTASSRLSRSSFLGSSRAFEKAMGGMVLFDGYQRAFVVNQPQLGEAQSTLAADAISSLQSSLSYKKTDLGGEGEQRLTVFESGGMAGGASALSFVSANHQITAGFGTAKTFYAQADQFSDDAYSNALGASFFLGAGNAGTSLENAMFAGGDYSLNSNLMISTLYLHGANDADPSGGTDLLSIGSRYSFAEGMALGVSYGLLREQGQMLGIRSSGGFSLGDVGLTQMGGVHFQARLDEQTRISAFAEASVSSANGTADSIFAAPSDWWGSRMGLTLSRSGVIAAGDMLSVSLIRPWRMDAGELSARIATGRELDGTVNYETRNISLGTHEVPLDLGLSYLKRDGAIGYAASVWLRDSDARNFGPNEVSVAAAVSWSF